MNETSIPATAPNLYMTGFMGTGKSVIGRKIAQQLNISFIDSDHFIEKEEGMNIPEIFEKKGEPYFRELEKQFIEVKQPRNATVISCGGGLVTNPDLLSQIKQSGVIIVLYASVDTLYKRIANDPNRPLMKSENPRQRIQDLLEERSEIYKHAGTGIMTDGYSIAEIADKAIRIYLDHL